MLYICHRFLKSMVLKWMEKKATFSADVKWDVENCAYNPKSTASQSFTVNGQLELREGENNEELDTSVKIRYRWMRTRG